MKTSGIVLVLALLCLLPITCSPVGKRSTQNKWYKTSPTFLLRLYMNISANRTSLAQLGASQVHGYWVTVKKPAHADGSQNEVNLLSPMTGTKTRSSKAFLVNLHLTVQAKTGAQLKQGNCNLVLSDIKTNTKVVSKAIPCASSSKLVITVTTYFKNWVANPATNLGLKVVISSQSDKFVPVSSLPFISADPNIEPPYYIVYVS